MSKSTKKIVIFLLLLPCFTYSQNEYSQWYFGDHAGMNFLISPPLALTNGVINTGEGCASIADQNGNLLFYTDGAKIWNRNHVVMANGSGLTGDYTSTQSALIIPQPGNNQFYYVFTLGSVVSSLMYSIVDMSLAAGNGSVIVKNTLLDTTMTEKLVSVRHCNGTDFWVVAHKYDSDEFKSYLVTSSGITNTVTTSYGLVISGPGFAGNMKISPTGRKLVSANYNISGFTLYDFDNTTGMVSNSVVIPSGDGVTYGCEFSPDGTKLYGTKESGSNYMTLYQWDICSGTGPSIIASQYTMAVPSQITGMQTGNDGKIYVSKFGKSSVAVINNPNLAGGACSYSHTQIILPSGYPRYDFPNFTARPCRATAPMFTYTVSNLNTCYAASFNGTPLSNTAGVCAAAAYSVQGAYWNFGDSASGNNNVSYQINTMHVYSGLGTYTAQLILYYSCGGGTDTLIQQVIVNQPCLSFSNSPTSCASLGSATVFPGPGAGPFTYTWLPSNQTGSVASNLSPGANTVIVQDTPSNLIFPQVFNIASNTFLNMNSNASTSVTCYGASTGTGAVNNVIGGSGNYLFQWTNGTITIASRTVSTLSAGIWSVSALDLLSNCLVVNSYYISQPPVPNLQLTASSPTACVSNSIVLSAIMSGGTAGSGSSPYTVNWLNSSTSSTLTVAKGQAGTYKFVAIGKDSLNCSVKDSLSIDFIALPNIIVADATICPMQIGTLVASGANSYTWNSNYISSSFLNSPSLTTTYSVVGSAFGCSSIAEASIIVLNAPIASILSNTPVCEGQILNLSGLGGTSYQWAGPSGFSAMTANASIINVSTINAGAYQLMVTAANGCTASTSNFFAALPKPTVSIWSDTVCTGQTLNLHVNAGGALNYVWWGPASFSSTLSAPSIQSAVAANTGTYLVMVTSAQGCTNSASTNAIVLQPPLLALSLNNNSLCANNYNGSANTVQVTFSGANTYSVASSDLVFASIMSNVTTCTAIPQNVSFNTTATATLMGSNGYCASSKLFTVAIIPNPELVLSEALAQTCAGDLNTLSVSGASNYYWNTAVSQYTLQNGGSVMKLRPTLNANIQVYGFQNACFSATEIFSVQVNPMPIIQLSTNSASICLRDRAMLKVTGTDASYVWSPNIGLNQTSAAVVFASPPATQQYTVIATANSCTSSASVKLTVFPLPQPLISKEKEIVCIGDTIKLIGTGAESYAWSGPLNLFGTGQQMAFAANLPQLSGDYTLTVTDTNSCKNFTSTYVQVAELPGGYLLDFNPDVCAPFCSSYEFVGLKDASIHTQWQFNHSTYAANFFRICAENAGTYDLEGSLVDQKTGCSSQLIYQLNVHEKPKATFQFTPKLPYEGFDLVQFKNVSQGEELSAFAWYILDKKQPMTTSKEASYLFEEAGEYPVVLVAQNKWLCSDTLIKVVEVLPDFEVYVPNTFTPNNDQRNDVFFPVTRSAKKCDLSIFDRWGQKIFQSTDDVAGWDGTFAGEPCKEDVYTWILKVNAFDGNSIVKNGNVTLIR